jgi:hypothetical protein
LIEEWADAADEGLRVAARWALVKLKLEHPSELVL